MPSAAAASASGPKLPPSKYLGNCSGHAPIVVASDAAAQSDIYSAVTLAGALGSRCVVLAGARGEAMPADQKRRLAAAESGGYVVGGTAAVPNSKVAGRRMVRISGADRWATAELVGAEAKRIGNGNPSTPKLITGTPPASTTTEQPQTGYTALAVQAVGLVWALRADGTLARWYVNYSYPTNPGGTYKAVSADGDQVCAIRTDDTLACWGANDFGTITPPEGRFKSVAAGSWHACAIRTDDTLTCWGSNRYGQANAPEGRFKAVAAGSVHSCAIRTDDTVACWGDSSDGQANAPEGRFKAVAARGVNSCAIRDDDTLTCWGHNVYGQANAPEGRFKAVAVEWSQACAIRDDDTLTCWGTSTNIEGTDLGRPDAPEGRFKALGIGHWHYCAIRTNGKAICWGKGYRGQTDAPPA